MDLPSLLLSSYANLKFEELHIALAKYVKNKFENICWIYVVSYFHDKNK